MFQLQNNITKLFMEFVIYFVKLILMTELNNKNIF